jgi:nucleoid DNA-binding protein
MNWRSTAGKSALVKMLMQEHGVSKRKSEKAVNAVFDGIARALRRGEPVELPIGWIQTAARPAKRPKRKIQRFSNIQTGKLSFSMVRYPDKIIRFRVNPALIEHGPFPPPPPRPELLGQGEELEQLLSRLGFPDVTGLNLGPLLGAADENLDWLLARLRFKKNASSSTSPASATPSPSCIGFADKARRFPFYRRPECCVVYCRSGDSLLAGQWRCMDLRCSATVQDHCRIRNPEFTKSIGRRSKIRQVFGCRRRRIGIVAGRLSSLARRNGEAAASWGRL